MLVEHNMMRKQLLSVPIIDKWGELLQYISIWFDGKENQSYSQNTLASLQAFNGDTNLIYGSVAALLLSQFSIIFVDDILDDDPRGLHNEVGYGETANMAQALQAACFLQIQDLDTSSSVKAYAVRELSSMLMGTAYGQSLDNENVKDEETYWHVIREKSCPYYRSTIVLGGIMAGVPDTTLQALFDLGNLIGEMVQIQDDVTDAFDVPANPDWQRKGNNLAILYGLDGDHEFSTKFEQYLGQTENPEMLDSAQEILIKSGALSYCVYHLLQRYVSACELLKSMNVPNPEFLQEILDVHVSSLEPLLASCGMDISIQDVISDMV